MAELDRFERFLDAQPVRLDEALGVEELAGGAELRLLPVTMLTAQDRRNWDELGEIAANQSVFSMPWFVEQSLNHCDTAGQAKLAIVQDGTGEWIGTMPLTQGWRYGRVPFPHWQAWRHPNMFTGSPLVRPGSEKAFWIALTNGLEERSTSRPALRLHDLPSDEASTKALIALCSEEGRPIKFDCVRSRAMLRAGDRVDHSWPQSLKPELRRRLGSLERKLVGELGEIEFAAHHESAWEGELVEKFLELERSGWKGRSGSALSCELSNEAFFRGVVARASTQGALEFATLHAGGHLLAMSTHFVSESGWSHGFKTTYDERFAASAPGVLLLARMTRHFVAKGYLPFDSCSAPEQQPIGKLWPSRREFIDCGVALGGKAGWSAFRALAFCEEFAHRHKAPTAANA